MNKKTLPSNGWQLKDWVETISIVTLFIGMYSLALAITVDHSRMSNAILAVLSLLGVVASFYLMTKLHDLFGVRSWELLWRIMLWVVGFFALAALLHGVGALLVSSPEDQRWIARYASLAVPIVMVLIRFIKFLIERADDHKKYQV